MIPRKEPGKLVEFCLGQRKKIVLVFLVLGIVFSIASAFVPINYNLADYLPRESPSTKGLDIINEEFDQTIPNGVVLLPEQPVSEVLEAKQKLEEIPTVEQVLWMDDVVDSSIPLSALDEQLKDTYMKEGKAKISFVVTRGKEVETLESVYQVMGEDVAVAGAFVVSAKQQEKAIGESIKAFLILIPIILLILFLTTTSWMEPVLYILTIGIAVILNWGTNVFLGQVSFITLAASPILQLAVSMDYAIFLLHRYREYKPLEKDKVKAMKQAVIRSFPVITASATTTFLGFAVLMLMRFEIGADLGLNLVKGIVFSFITVLLLLPCLTLLFDAFLEKFKHKQWIPAFSSAGGKLLAVRYVIFFLAVVAIIPCFLGQNNNTFLYGMSEGILPQSREGKDKASIEEVYGKEVFIALLVPRGDPDKEGKLEEELKRLEYVEEVLSYSQIVGTGIPEYFVSQEVAKNFRSPHYSRILLRTSTEEESKQAFSLIKEVKTQVEKYYPEDWWILGESVSLYDIKEVVTKDRKVVAGMAVLAIGMVIALAFRSFLLPLILLLTIETSIWINLSIPYFTDVPLNYIGFLIITTVQLGVTVDYAILLTHNYQTHRCAFLPKEAMKKTLGETLFPILISATMLIMAGGTMWLVSTDPIISELGLLLGRGGMLSTILVLFFLPTLLLLLDRWILKERKLIRRK